MSLLVFRLPVKVYRAAFTPRLLPHIRVASSSHPFIRAMGGGGSKEEGGKKKSTRKSKETVSVATTVQSEVAAEKEDTVSSDEYIECKVAKASEFGENE